LEGKLVVGEFVDTEKAELTEEWKRLHDLLAQEGG
jgi:hypothetical protein